MLVSRLVSRWVRNTAAGFGQLALRGRLGRLPSAPERASGCLKLPASATPPLGRLWPAIHPRRAVDTGRAHTLALGVGVKVLYEQLVARLELGSGLELGLMLGLG